MRFRVLSFNIWGLEIFGRHSARDLSKRLDLIPQAVASSGADIVALQEVWTPRGGSIIETKLRQFGYKFFVSNRRRFPFGNGLLIASKLPLDAQSQVLGFRQYTQWTEFWVRKGAIKTRFYVEGIGWADFYNAHLGSVSRDQKTGLLHKNPLEIRNDQIRELIKWIQKTRTSDLLYLAADLNMNDFDHAGLEFCQEYKDLIGALSLEDALSLGRGGREWWQPTYCPVNNVYAREGLFRNHPSERVDYIFHARNSKITARSSDVVFRTPVQSVQLSDHFGVLAEYILAAS